MNIFEKASRLKIRFVTNQGHLIVDDLWDMPMESLDDIAIALNRKIKDAGEESFVTKGVEPDERLQTAFDVVKHVIDVRLDEIEQEKLASTVRARRQKIMAIIASKEDQGLLDTDLDALRAMLTD